MKDLRKKEFIHFYNFILQIFLSLNKKVNIKNNYSNYTKFNNLMQQEVLISIIVIWS